MPQPRYFYGLLRPNHKQFTAVLFQMLDFNVPGGKLNRGMAVYDVLAAISGAEVRSWLANVSVNSSCQGLPDRLQRVYCCCRTSARRKSSKLMSWAGASSG